MNAQVPRIASASERCSDSGDNALRHALVRGHEFGRDEVVFEEVFHRFDRVAVDVDARPMVERGRRPDEMYPGDEATELPEQFEIIEVRRAAAAAGIHRHAEVPDLVQRTAVDTEGRDDRYLLLRELRRKPVLFQYRLVGPAVRAIEFRNDGVVVVDTHLVDAILVAVEREQAAVAVKTEILERIEEVLWLEVGVGE